MFRTATPAHSPRNLSPVSRLSAGTDTLTDVRNLVGTAACAVLIGAGACATAAPAAACPYGTVPSDFAGVCVSGQSGGGQVIPPDPSQSGAVISGGPDELPSVDGIPCTPQQLGACIGLAESAR